MAQGNGSRDIKLADDRLDSGDLQKRSAHLLQIPRAASPRSHASQQAFQIIHIAKCFAQGVSKLGVADQAIDHP